MGYSVKILKDSRNPVGVRLTTFELTYPRFVHSEFMTHRVFSRNSASSRAIPVAKLIERVTNDPVVPVYWGKNQKGMQADEELTSEQQEQALAVWLEARDTAISFSQKLMDIGVHKQLANRLIEPWMFITVICTATDYGHMFNLRYDRNAQPEIQKLAAMMVEQYYSNEPKDLAVGEWHLPLILPDEMSLAIDVLKKVSIARCARVSYLTHSGVRDISEDLRLHDQLGDNGHWSPFEHAAEAQDNDDWIGNFRGWKQYRKEFPEEYRPDFDYESKKGLISFTVS